MLEKVAHYPNSNTRSPLGNLDLAGREVGRIPKNPVGSISFQKLNGNSREFRVLTVAEKRLWTLALPDEHPAEVDWVVC
jgi:hypothetical protein